MMTAQARRENLVVQDVNNEVLIYDLNDQRVYNLNEITAFVWNNLDGQTGFEELAVRASSNFRKIISADYILLAVHELDKANLIDTKTILPQMSKINRREIIRRIGLTTALALPAITSIIAPLSVQASSAPCVLPSGAIQYFGAPYNCPPNDNACAYTNCSSLCCTPVRAAHTEPNGAIYCECS